MSGRQDDGQSAAGRALLDLVEVIDRLRSPGGCPWDRAQDHRSLARYLLEETYETLEAIDSGDQDHLQEELGDLLMQVVFHARVAAEDGSFTIDDVAAGITEKLVRRHPHVFGTGETSQSLANAPTLEFDTPDRVEQSWERLKAEEKGRESVLDGIPTALPALARAEKHLSRVARLGMDIPVPAAPVLEPASVQDLGDALLGLASVAQRNGWDAEQSLREAVGRFADDVRAAESRDRAREG